MTARSKEERRAIARRIYEALSTQYPDRSIVLVEDPALLPFGQNPKTPPDLAIDRDLPG